MRAALKQEIPEADVQQAIVEGLGYYGYTVLVTSRIRKRCSCGRWPKSGQGDGVTKGLADLLVTHSRWPEAIYVAIECKGSETPLSPEQKVLHAAKRIVVARSWEDAWEAVQAAERWIFGEVD